MEQIKMDEELNELVKHIKYKAQVKLKLELHRQAVLMQREKSKYLL
jgi:hypothetical protein